MVDGRCTKQKKTRTGHGCQRYLYNILIFIYYLFVTITTFSIFSYIYRYTHSTPMIIPFARSVGILRFPCYVPLVRAVLLLLVLIYLAVFFCTSCSFCFHSRTAAFASSFCNGWQCFLCAGQYFAWQSVVQNNAYLQPLHFVISTRGKECWHPRHLSNFSIPFASVFLSFIQLQYDLVARDKELITPRSSLFKSSRRYRLI